MKTSARIIVQYLSAEYWNPNVNDFIEKMSLSYNFKEGESSSNLEYDEFIYCN
jgi:hypothetical protein